MSKPKCPECQGTGWYHGKQEHREIRCPMCLGSGFFEGYTDPWDEEERLANECGNRSMPRYRVERYGGKTKGPGFKKVIWLD